MQILSIRGKNIASLAQPFELRLDQPPLSTAGLFAITGETGAGKSSLLDSLCLALYGNCPRLSGEGTRESVEEADGQELKSNDPRMALRRGAAEGYAEVAFIGVDGVGYQAAWSARRARGRIDGRLQFVDRSLRRLSDGQVLETQATTVASRIVTLTGLTYDEFRRTVLLAQGDFDAFLCAKTADRAAILEKVTGTGLYRDISRHIFDRHAAAKTALETLETRRAEHRLLTDDQRAELAAQTAALLAAQAEGEAALALVQSDLARWRSLAEAQGRLDAAARRAEAANRALTDCAPDRDWLAEWEAARILRGEVKERGDAAGAVTLARAGWAALRDKAAAQAAELDGAVQAVAAALSARDQTEERFKSFAEAWSRATELDAMIATAAAERDKAQGQVTATLTQEAKAQGDLADLTTRRDRLDQSIATHLAALEATPGHEALLANWAMVEDRLTARIALSARQTAETAERDRLLADNAADRSARSALTGRITAAAGRIDAAQAQMAAMAADRDRLRARDPAARLQTLAQAAMDLRAMAQAQGALRQADQALTDSRAKSDTATRARAEAGADLHSAVQAEAAARGGIDALRRPAEAAEAAASTEAAHLRAHLVAGEPCPVCHATDHPLMADSGIAALAADLRDRLAEAQAAHDRARQSALDAQAKAAQAEAVLASESARAPGLLAAVQAAEAAFAEARADLGRHLPKGLPSPLPADPRDGDLSALTDHLAAARMAAEADHARLATLDRQHAEATATTEAARTEIAAAEAEQRLLAHRLDKAEARLATLEQSLPALAEEIARIDDRLTPILAACGEVPAAYGAAGADALARLQRRVAALADRTARLAADRAALSDLAPALAGAEAALTAARRSVAEAQGMLAERLGAHDGLTAERRALLGGEDTATHRTRHNDARKSAQQALDRAQQAEARARAMVAETTGALAGAERAMDQAATRLAVAEQALTAACDAAGLALSRVLDLHATPEEAITARRARLTAATQEQAEATGVLRARQEEWQAVQAAGLPTLPVDDLTARQTALEAASAERDQALGRIAEKLDADRQAAAALAGLEAEITAARQTQETWAAVNDAVGSASGDRFAQIAQAVTLSLLVERANLHLSDLKPRYRLEVAASDLALQVIDLDMAGDRRPARLLSGGERFLVSLALALALSGMGTQGALVGTLFIDEGFGSLDGDSLDLAIDALERLQAQGRMIGVISHVQAMKDRIPVQVEVRKTGGGASEVSLKLQ